MRSARSEAWRGVAYACAAYGSWGLLPIYWKALAAVPVGEVLAYRVVGSALFAALLVGLAREGRTVRAALGARRTVSVLAATSLLIGANWLLFIWTVSRGDVLASSLGYFLNPLVNVALGRVFLGERLRGLQLAAVALASLGVAVLAASAGGLPWVSLTLAITFGCYGLLRKLAPIPPLVSLLVETAALAPVALGYLTWVAARGEGHFVPASGEIRALLLGAGVVTALPLVWFSNAARRLRLGSLGFFQYLAPTGHFALAVLVYGEPFGRAHLVTFGCIWTGLLLYSVDAVRAARSATAPASEAAAVRAPGAAAGGGGRTGGSGVAPLGDPPV